MTGPTSGATGAEPGPVRVAVVDDPPVFRQGLARAVNESASLDLEVAAPSVEALPADLAVDVVILDLGLPGISGPEAVANLRDRGAIVLVVSAMGARQQVIDAMAAGAAGYLTKSADPAEIIDAVVTVAAGGTYVSPTLASFLIVESRLAPANSGIALTVREREVLSLLASGERDVDIAERLHISLRTVHSHLDRIRGKTGYRRRPDLTRLAVAEGLVAGPGPGPGDGVGSSGARTP